MTAPATEVPGEILRLIARFDTHADAYKSGQYNETQLRVDFLDPLFAALGWDVHNKQGHAEAYRDVIHEDAIRIGGFHKAPDYCFRIGGARKFFLEAKKPAVDIRGDISPAYQLRRYAWSAKLPLSILSDFEEFAVYDCRVKPAKDDPASTARVFLCEYRDLPKHWPWIASIFSRDAVLKGSFDKYAAENKAKRGTAAVDDDFLATIEDWRAELARNLALRNPDLSQRELNFSVGRIIDRIVFLRICEDRGLEDHGRLLALVNGPRIYPRLCELFRDADARYNSGLFHFKPEKGRETPDAVTLGLDVDDKLLKQILRGLYYPESPYEFGVISADILGQVYEQFLGKVIRLTPGHRAVVEEKPEVRKAGGVYYTPTYIVDYIVRETLGKLLEGKSPKDAASVRVLDPACGSGSFLIGAYQFLLDWHLDWYAKNDPDRHAKGKAPALVRAPGGPWALATAERKRILLNSIFGVDIDEQAVEVTKLSLLLKVLEGETRQNLEPMLNLFHERALPDLARNIQCGNSLVAPDFFQQPGLPALDDEDRLRVNAFDWNTAFPDAMKAGGFDAVIGNPPYVRIQTMTEWAPVEVEAYKKIFTSAGSGNYDLYVVFVEKGLGLLSTSGRLGFILPHKFFNSKYGEGLRQIIANGHHLRKVVHFGDQQVFAGATTYTCLLFLSKCAVPECEFLKVDDLSAWQADGSATTGAIPADRVTETEWNFTVGEGAGVLARLNRLPEKLGNVAHIFVGLQTSADGVYVVPLDAEVEPGITRPFLLTGELSAYALPKASARLIFPYEQHDGRASLLPADVLKKRFPNGWAHLSAHREGLMGREGGKWRHDQWYAFGRSQNLTQMDDPKLIIQVTAKCPTVLYDDAGLYMTGGGSGPFYGIRPKGTAFPIKYLLAILNSRLFGYIIKAQSTNLRGGYIKFSKQYIENAPLVRPEPAGDARIGEITGHVDAILSLLAKSATVSTPHEQTVLDRQIASSIAAIDRLVYDLYGLTTDEVRVVEGAG